MLKLIVRFTLLLNIVHYSNQLSPLERITRSVDLKDHIFDPLTNYLQSKINSLLSQKSGTCDIISFSASHHRVGRAIDSVVANVTSILSIAKYESAIHVVAKRCSVVLLEAQDSRALGALLEMFTSSTDGMTSYFQNPVHRPRQHFVIVSDRRRTDLFHKMKHLGAVSCVWVWPSDNARGLGVLMTNRIYTKFYDFTGSSFPESPFTWLSNDWTGFEVKVMLFYLPPYLIATHGHGKLLSSFDLDILAAIRSHARINVTRRRVLAGLSLSMLEQKMKEELDKGWTDVVTRYPRAAHFSNRMPLPQTYSWCIKVQYVPRWDFAGFLQAPFDCITWITTLIAIGLTKLTSEPRRRTLRFILLTAYALIYTTSSISHRTVARLSPGPVTVDDFIREDINFYLPHERFHDFVQFLELVPRLQPKFKATKIIPEATETHPVATFAPCAVAYWESRRARDLPRSYLVRRHFAPEMQMFATRRNFGFFARLQWYIWQLAETGIFQKLGEDFAERTSGAVMKRLGQRMMFGVRDLKHLWMLLGGGWFVGIVVFVVEVAKSYKFSYLFWKKK